MECNGCFCRGGSGNNWPSTDDFYSTKIKCLSSDISALVRLRKQHHKLDDGPRFPCSQCDQKFTMSHDLHSHTNSVHLKIKPFKCETCKRLLAHKRSFQTGRYTCTVKAQDVCGHCGKVYKSRGSLEDHARTHGGSLPYPCNKCLVRFTYRNQLRRHSKKCLS